MFWDEEVTPEEAEKLIDWLAREIYRYGLETAAIMFLESLKPISRVLSSMGQIFLTPILPILGDNLMLKGDKAMLIFEDEENVEKLIRKLEYLAVNGFEAETEIEAESHEENTEEKEEKKGWRSYLPF